MIDKRESGGKMILKQPKKSLFKRAWFWWVITPLVVIGLILLSFRLSPWPGAMIIRQVFTDNGKKVTAKLNAHLPSKVISVIEDQVYKPGDNDALLDVYTSEDVSDATVQPTVIWTHGGAWLSGDKQDASGYFKLLAAQGYTVIAPNYSRAPEATYPKAIEQLNSAHKYIIDNAQRFHVDADAIFLAGDSAGAQLSAQLAAIATNAAYAAEVGIEPSLKPEQLKGVILNCGIYKMDELVHPDPTLPKLVGWGDDVAVWGYAGTHNFTDPVIRQMSPFYHINENFPSTYISGGNGDPLTNVQSRPLADALLKLGVNVTTLFYENDHTPSLPHEYQFNLDNEDGKAALIKTIEFIKNQSNSR